MAKLFSTKESLNIVKKYLDVASQAIGSDEVISKNDPILSETLAAIAGMGAGATASFVALGSLGVAGYSAAGITSGLAAAGSVLGGGMVAGIGVLAAPVAILGVGGYALIANRNKKELVKELKALYNSAISKQNQIIDKLNTSYNLSEEKRKELKHLNILLKGIINDLKKDLGV